MKSAVNTLVVKMNQKAVQNPTVGQSLRVVDRTGIFIVMSVDRKRNTVDLMDNGGTHEVLQDVPFEKLRSPNNNLKRTIQDFLDSSREMGTRKAL